MSLKNMVTKSLFQLREESIESFEVTENMILMGDNGVLDSMDFVNLMVIIEENIFEELGKEITIVNEKAFSRKRSPFYSIDTLSEYLQELIGE